MEIGLRVPLDGEVIREGAVVLPARLLVDVVRSLPGDSVTLELRSAEQDVEIVAGAATFHIRTLRLEDFPPFPEAEGDGRVQVPGAGVRRDRAEGRPLGLARRDAPGAHRHPRLGQRRRAPHGRDRLLPALRQGDEARRAARRRLRGERAGPGAAGAQPHRRPGGRGRAERRRPHQPGDLRGRRHRAVVAADRRPVPELPPAAARRVRARAPARRRRDHRRRAPHLAARAEERAAPARVQRGRADGLGAHARRRRGARDAAGARTAASRWRSASTPSSCATASRRWTPATCC